jgi:hypothetical protein
MKKALFKSISAKMDACMMRVMRSRSATASDSNNIESLKSNEKMSSISTNNEQPGRLNKIPIKVVKFREDIDDEVTMASDIKDEQYPPKQSSPPSLSPLPSSPSHSSSSSSVSPPSSPNTVMHSVSNEASEITSKTIVSDKSMRNGARPLKTIFTFEKLTEKPPSPVQFSPSAYEFHMKKSENRFIQSNLIVNAELGTRSKQNDSLYNDK